MRHLATFGSNRTCEGRRLGGPRLFPVSIYRRATRRVRPRTGERWVLVFAAQWLWEIVRARRLCRL